MQPILVGQQLQKLLTSSHFSPNNPKQHLRGQALLDNNDVWMQQKIILLTYYRERGKCSKLLDHKSKPIKKLQSDALGDY